VQLKNSIKKLYEEAVGCAAATRAVTLKENATRAAARK
jgi:hypothetical protein